METEHRTTDSEPPENWIACPDCDLINRIPGTKASHTAECSRCGAALHQSRSDGFDSPLALALAGLVLFWLANSYPLMTFEMSGRRETSTLISGVIAFWKSGFPGLSVLVFLTSIAVPLVGLLSTVYVLLSLRFGFRSWLVVPVFRVGRWLRPWAMTEVYMLGIFVAIVKLVDFAEIVPGTALYSFAALVLISATGEWRLDVRRVWMTLEATK